MDERFYKQENKRAFGRAWELLRYWQLPDKKIFPRKIERIFRIFRGKLKKFMSLIHVFSRNRERCSAKPLPESTALDGSEPSAAGFFTCKLPVRVNHGKKKNSSLCLIYSSAFVQKHYLILNLNLQQNRGAS